MRTLLQNLPTIVNLKAKEYNEAVLEFRNTDAKKHQKVLDGLRDPKNLVKLFGLMQLLELYAHASVLSQSSTSFPLQVWGKILTTQETLGSLTRLWKWEDEDLKLSCMEAPAVMIKRLVEERLYRPKIFQRNVRSYRDLEEAGLLADDEKISDLFLDDGEPVKPLAGEVIMEEITWEEVEQVEKELKQVSKKLLDTWKEKQKHVDLDR